MNVAEIKSETKLKLKINIMELNQFLFPAPTPSYSSAGFIGEIIYVPKYARNLQTGEAVQFSDPAASEVNLENREQSAAIVDVDSPLIR